GRLRAVAGHRLDAEDARALDCLLDPLDPRSVLHRDALFYRTSPRVHLAYRAD
ncbi:MAG: hypothetical protein JWQ18_3828, partial [Conexibacter sp.]|nr:hypothetical protein [Conexibacter sp.]